ncbi:MAG TPA: type II secretion system protein [Bryobacteraceae bacterium]|nr:type II secretion system protein [Bryobacteraceae bacterium]
MSFQKSADSSPDHLLTLRAATVRQRSSRKNRNRRGLTLIELIVAFSIMLILSSMAVPLARARIQAERRKALLYALTDMRHAIDRYKDNCDLGYFGPPKQGSNCYPESLTILVEGVKLAQSADGKVMKFLRRIPLDPLTNKTEWGLRSDQDDPTATSWGGQNVFDVYTKSTDKDADGKPYADW